MFDQFYTTLESLGIVPVVVLDKVEDAAPLAHALMAAGMKSAEVTFRTACAAECIAAMAEAEPEMCVGAGTVLTVEQVEQARAAGAKFIVSPGYNEDVVKHCIDIDLPVLPGTVTPSEVTAAVNLGLKVTKFFPAAQYGGLNTIKALAAPFVGHRFMPTGGISIKNFSEYLGYDRVRLCGGSWMAKSELIEGEQWDKITALCRQAVGTMLNFTLQHVGLPCGSADAAASTARAICRLFGLEYRQGNTSDFAVPFVECCKAELPGTHGHIAIGTPDVERAEFHLGLQGTEFLEHTRKVDDKGRTKAIYLNQTFAGFAVHLMRK